MQPKGSHQATTAVSGSANFLPTGASHPHDKVSPPSAALPLPPTVASSPSSNPPNGSSKKSPVPNASNFSSSGAKCSCPHHQHQHLQQQQQQQSRQHNLPNPHYHPPQLQTRIQGNNNMVTDADLATSGSGNVGRANNAQNPHHNPGQNGQRSSATSPASSSTPNLQLEVCAWCYAKAGEPARNSGSTENGGEVQPSTAVTLWACSGCLKVAYCSKECQRLHWKTHKSQCFIDQARNWVNEKRATQNNAMNGGEYVRNGHQNHDHNGHNHKQDLSNGDSNLVEIIDSDSDSDTDENSVSTWDRTIADLWRRTEMIQRQHEALQRDLNTTMQALTESLRTFNIPLPASAAKKTKPQLASMKTPEHLASLWQRCTSTSEKVQLSATKECRKLLSDQHPPIKELVDMGLIPVFVNLLRRSRNPKLQFEAAWVLTNICSGTSEQTQAVIESGAVAALTDLLCSKDEELAEQCVWALGNIAADSPTCRDILLEHGIIEALMPLLNSNRLTMLKNLSWTMSNLCNGVRECYWNKILMALSKFSRLIFCSDEEILKDVCWSLSYLSGATKDSIQAIVELDPLVCKRLVELLTHRSPSVQHAALIAVGNIVTGDDEQTQILIDHQILPRLRRLLGHSKTSILKDTCFTLSNIAAGNQKQIQALIDARIIPALINLYSTAKYEVKVEATWALSNALSNGTDAQIRFMVNNNCMKPMCDLLLLCDLSTIEAVLEGFEHILRVGEADAHNHHHPTNTHGGGGKNLFAERMRNECLDMLQILQRHINESLISNKLANLIARLQQPPSTNPEPTK